MSKARYYKLRHLCSGRTSEIDVGVAVHEGGLQKVCVLKSLLAEHVGKPELTEALKQEAAVGESLMHTNLVPTTAFTLMGQVPTLVMEFVEGVDLDHLIRCCRENGMRFSAAMAVHIVAEIARGLGYFHRRARDTGFGAVERLAQGDVQPSNVLISFEGEVKLGDFGADPASRRRRREAAQPEDDLCDLMHMLGELLLDGSSELPAGHEALKKTLPEADDDLIQLLERGIAGDFSSAEQLEKELTTYLHRQHSGFTHQRLGVFIKTVLPKDVRRVQGILKAAASFVPPSAPLSTRGAGSTTEAQAPIIVQFAADAMRSETRTKMQKGVDLTLSHDESESARSDLVLDAKSQALRRAAGGQRERLQIGMRTPGTARSGTRPDDARPAMSGVIKAVALLAFVAVGLVIWRLAAS